jgi:ribosomal protein L34E
MIPTQQIDTCCPCGRPLAGIITHRGERTRLTVVDAAADKPHPPITVCPSCRRALPHLTAEQFQDEVARG